MKQTIAGLPVVGLSNGKQLGLKDGWSGRLKSDAKTGTIVLEALAQLDLMLPMQARDSPQPGLLFWIRKN